MNKSQRYLVLIFLVGALSVYISQSLTQKSEYGDVTVERASDLMDSKPELVVLDVRTQEEYDDEHIEGAILIPVQELEERIDELSKDDELLVYCRTGNRSGTAVSILQGNGFQKIYHMSKGITEWKAAGYPTV